jgi:hypothetical protein
MVSRRKAHAEEDTIELFSMVTDDGVPRNSQSSRHQTEDAPAESGLDVDETDSIGSIESRHCVRCRFELLFSVLLLDIGLGSRLEQHGATVLPKAVYFIVGNEMCER